MLENHERSPYFLKNGIQSHSLEIELEVRDKSLKIKSDDTELKTSAQILDKDAHWTSLSIKAEMT